MEVHGLKHGIPNFKKNNPHIIHRFIFSRRYCWRTSIQIVNLNRFSYFVIWIIISHSSNCITSFSRPLLKVFILLGIKCLTIYRLIHNTLHIFIIGVSTRLLKFLAITIISSTASNNKLVSLIPLKLVYFILKFILHIRISIPSLLIFFIITVIYKLLRSIVYFNGLSCYVFWLVYFLKI